MNNQNNQNQAGSTNNQPQKPPMSGNGSAPPVNQSSTNPNQPVGPSTPQAPIPPMANNGATNPTGQGSTNPGQPADPSAPRAPIPPMANNETTAAASQNPVSPNQPANPAAPRTPIPPATNSGEAAGQSPVNPNQPANPTAPVANSGSTPPSPGFSSMNPNPPNQVPLKSYQPPNKGGGNQAKTVVLFAVIGVLVCLLGVALITIFPSSHKIDYKSESGDYKKFVFEKIEYDQFLETMVEATIGDVLADACSDGEIISASKLGSLGFGLGLLNVEERLAEKLNFPDDFSDFAYVEGSKQEELAKKDPTAFLVEALVSNPPKNADYKKDLKETTEKVMKEKCGIGVSDDSDN